MFVFDNISSTIEKLLNTDLQYCNMVKTVQVENHTWQKLTKLKAEKMMLTLNDVIEYLINEVKSKKS